MKKIKDILSRKQVVKLAITLVKSRFGRTPIQRACVKALGLKKIRQVVYRDSTPENLGLLKKVGFLLNIEEVIQ